MIFQASRSGSLRLLTTIPIRDEVTIIVDPSHRASIDVSTAGIGFEVDPPGDLTELGVIDLDIRT